MRFITLIFFVLSVIGCASIEPIIKIKKEPYPVPVHIPCTQGVLPPEIELHVMDVTEDTDWETATDALVQDVQQLKRENDALRKELEACGKPKIE